MHVARHVFGSYKGYSTLAKSPGVSADDCRAIEGAAFGFGQSYDTRYYRSLARTPAYFTRALRGGKRALTRVLEGTLDDNQRPTLRLVTAIVTQQDWDLQIKGDVGWLLQQPQIWEWDGSPQLAPIELPGRSPMRGLGRSTVPLVLALLSEVENHWASRRTTVVSANQYSVNELAALEMLIPGSARSQFTSANRSLSPQLPSSVNCLATEANAQDKVNFRYQPNGGLSPYAQCLAEMDLTSAIPLEFIMSYNRFGASAPRSTLETLVPVAPSPLTIHQRPSPMPLLAVAALAVVLAVAAFLGATVLTRGQIDQLSQQVKALTTSCGELKKANDKASADITVLRSDLTAGNKNIQALQKDVGDHKTVTVSPKNHPNDTKIPGEGFETKLNALQGTLAAENKKKDALEKDLTTTKALVDTLRMAMKSLQQSQYEKLTKDVQQVLEWKSLPPIPSVEQLESSLKDLGEGAFLDPQQRADKEKCLIRISAAKCVQAIKKELDDCNDKTRIDADSKRREELRKEIKEALNKIDIEITKMDNTVVKLKIVGDGAFGLPDEKDKFTKRLETIKTWLKNSK
jgi:uncharacterized coiled-coil DUF342 family protein